MTIAIRLPVRTWAVLDAAVTFFRESSDEIPYGRSLGQACRRLHRALRRGQVRGKYMKVGHAARGKPLLRMMLPQEPSPRSEVPLELTYRVARGLARACIAVIEVQSNIHAGMLLDHEAEELQAARDFLSELRRQGNTPALVPYCHDECPLMWDSRRKEYTFVAPVAERLQQHYLRAGASLN